MNDPNNAPQANAQAPNDPHAQAQQAPVQSAVALNPAVRRDTHPTLQRSNLILNSERFVMEQQHMSKLKSGGGPLGTRRIRELEVQKRAVCQKNLTNDKAINYNDEILHKLHTDGIYTDDPEVHSKFTDINVQKLEERLLNNGHSEFFKTNGELKLDNDLLEDEITRPVDLAFDKTVAFMYKETNAILSNRMHSFKKQYYRLDIIVGKVNLFNYRTLFSEEDRLALKLKNTFKQHEMQVSLGMIPFYEDRLRFITEELANEATM